MSNRTSTGAVVGVGFSAVGPGSWPGFAVEGWAGTCCGGAAGRVCCADAIGATIIRRRTDLRIRILTSRVRNQAAADRTWAGKQIQKSRSEERRVGKGGRK